MRLGRRAAQFVSRILGRRPSLLFELQEGGLKLSYAALDLKMATWVVRRPEWLLKKPGPPAELIDAEAQFGPATPDLELAARTIAAYGPQPSAGDTVATDSIWGHLLQTHFAEQCRHLSNRDRDGMADFQSRLFRSTAVNGFSYGSTFDDWPHRWHYLPIHIELSVVQLAEALGVLRTECHEQGEIAFWRSLMSAEDLMAALDAAVGFRIEQPAVGNPRGIIFGGRFLTRETCSQIYTAYRVRQAIERADLPTPLDIVEIGGGFGGTCYWMHRTLGDNLGRYVIVDLPEVSLIQASFLGQATQDLLVLPGEARRPGKRSIELVVHTDLDTIDFQPAVVINQDSMPEMPRSEVVRYLSWIDENLRGLFFSFNQETLSQGGSEAQINVPALVKEMPRLKRTSRELSWDRRGYVEEIYASSPV